jgi:hypothetical protein
VEFNVECWSLVFFLIYLKVSRLKKKKINQNP